MLAVGAVVERADHMLVGCEAVLVDLLGAAIAVDVEVRADMGKRIPLRRVLRMQQHGIVATTVIEGAFVGKAVVRVGLAMTHRGFAARRLAGAASAARAARVLAAFDRMLRGSEDARVVGISSSVGRLMACTCPQKWPSSLPRSPENTKSPESMYPA